MQCFAGAKNHMLIMPDADMDQAADALGELSTAQPERGVWLYL